ncbi:MAG: hypothetical protein K8R36_20775 [Planctomycetales bacterium]|nr:hypothetical protein [Planctomycetales bacterium]
MKIKQLFLAGWREDDGVLSFEWTLLVVLLVFGIVSGLCAARDGIIDELSDQAAAIMAFDQSYSFSGFGTFIPASSYTDNLGVVTDCGRNTLPGQAAADDVDS